MASGLIDEIRHPEMINVGPTSAFVHSFLLNEPNSAARFRELSLVLIEAVEPLDAPAT